MITMFGVNPGFSAVGSSSISAIPGLADALAKGSLDGSIFHLETVENAEFTAGDLVVQLDKRNYIFTTGKSKFRRLVVDDNFSGVQSISAAEAIPAHNGVIQNLDIMPISNTACLVIYQNDATPKEIGAVVITTNSVGTPVKIADEMNGLAFSITQNGTDLTVMYTNGTSVKTKTITISDVILNISEESNLGGLI